MSVNIGGILPTSLSNGDGMRYTIFFAGCLHACKGCHNEHMWALNSGHNFEIEELQEKIKELADTKIISGITLTGGDPILQYDAAYELANYSKELGLDVWMYTGYTFEELIDLNNYKINMLLDKTDILVDGKFVEELKDESLYMRGSSNQRILIITRGDNNEIIAIERAH
jgi:anaerobic ribonucleoside-triphosphate reductase activating protein